MSEIVSEDTLRYAQLVLNRAPSPCSPSRFFLKTRNDTKPLCSAAGVRANPPFRQCLFFLHQGPAMKWPHFQGNLGTPHRPFPPNRKKLPKIRRNHEGTEEAPGMGCIETDSRSRLDLLTLSEKTLRETDFRDVSKVRFQDPIPIAVAEIFIRSSRGEFVIVTSVRSLAKSRKWPPKTRFPKRRHLPRSIDRVTPIENTAVRLLK